MQKKPAPILIAAALLSLSACSQPHTEADKQNSQAAASPASDAKQQCLALKNLKIADTEISKAEWSEGEVPADEMSALTGGAKTALKASPHCVLTGEIGARTGADGKPYGTKFQLRLPEA